MKTRPHRFFILAPLAALALAAAGCGGGAKSGSSTSSGATLVRSDAVAYVSIDSDMGSDQWKQLDALAKKFPGRDLAIAGIESQLGEQGVNWKDDVEPALGPEVDVGVVGTSLTSNPSFAVLTQPNDEGKFKALVTKMNAQDSGNPAVYRKVGDWYALSDSQQMIDRVLAPKDAKTLADDSAFKEGLSKLPDAALVKAYVNTKKLAPLTAYNSPQGAAPYAAGIAALRKLDSLSAALSAEDDGVRLHGATVGQELTGGAYASELLAQAPADALAFLTFRNGSEPAAIDQIGGALQATLGITGKQIAALFKNETALWVRPGAVIPEVTAILQPDHTVVGLRTLDKLAGALGVSAGATFHQGAQRTLDFGNFALRYGAVGGKIVITSAPGGIAGASSSGEKLPAGADFSEAKDAAGLPDSTSGFIYIDLKNAIPLLEGFAALSGGNLGSTMSANLRPLRSFLAWGASSGDTQTFDAFLEIK